MSLYIFWHRVLPWLKPLPALGRLVRHDPRSLLFLAEVSPLVSVLHIHNGDVLNQGKIGSCTGNATAQILNTDPLKGSRSLLAETDALNIYHWATVYDNIKGTYPPNDTGSSGLSAAKAAKKLGYIKSYSHAFGLQHVLGALALRPVIIGIPWLKNMFVVPANGILDVTGAEVGGHEIALIGLDVENQEVIMLNSWGPSWGSNGSARIRWSDLDLLLKQQGDCTVLLT